MEKAQEDGADVVDQLLPIVYSELRQMANAKLAKEKPGQTLDATGLVHEAYLRMLGPQKFESRRHFFAAAAEAMRRILIDRVRAKNTLKRGQALNRVDVEPDELLDVGNASDKRLETLNLAIERLAKKSPEKAELVKLRYFVGLTICEAAEILGISTATADRNWKFAKAWLKAECNEGDA